MPYTLTRHLAGWSLLPTGGAMADDQSQPHDGDEDRGHLMSAEQWNAVVAARQAYLEEIGEPDEQTPLHYTSSTEGGE